MIGTNGDARLFSEFQSSVIPQGLYIMRPGVAPASVVKIPYLNRTGESVIDRGSLRGGVSDIVGGIYDSGV